MRWKACCKFSLLVLAFCQPTASAEQRLLSALPLDWQTPPSEDDTFHLIFNSASSWLQHWPNTRWRNGHSIVPGFISPGTVLYHGSPREEIPGRPDWVSFDSEHSYLFGMFLHTFAVNGPGRGLRVVYLDGSSASNMRSGTIDTQELIIRGEIQPTKWRDERSNILEMCEWGRKYGVQGIVRMEFDFEVMICDFTDGLTQTSVTRTLPPEYPSEPSEDLAFAAQRHPRLGQSPLLLPPRSPPRPGNPRGPWPDMKPPKGWKGRLLSVMHLVFEAIQAGNWHNFHPGVPGVELDYSASVSLHDAKYSSLARARRSTEEREKYRAGNISRSDMELVMAELDEVLRRPGSKGSGVRWGDIMRSVKERYSQRLDYLSYIVEGRSTTGANVTDTVVQTRSQLLMMLSPFLERKPLPPDSSLAVWLAHPMHHCATHLTAHIRDDWLTPQEMRLKHSTEGVLREICRTLGSLWIDVYPVDDTADDAQKSELLRKWAREVAMLQKWLGWAEWIKCDPPCHPTSELCSLPQWPLNMGRWDEEDDPCSSDYRPTCINRALPQLSWGGCKGPRRNAADERT